MPNIIPIFILNSNSYDRRMYRIRNIHVKWLAAIISSWGWDIWIISIFSFFHFSVFFEFLVLILIATVIFKLLETHLYPNTYKHLTISKRNVLVDGEVTNCHMFKLLNALMLLSKTKQKERRVRGKFLALK